MAQNSDTDLIVSGYRFQTIEEADVARVEQQRVSILEEKMDYDNIASVAMIYEKSVRNHVFITPVGIVFLAKLRTFLTEHDRPEALMTIPVAAVKSEEVEAEPVDMEQMVSEEEEQIAEQQAAKMERLERQIKEQKQQIRLRDERIKTGKMIMGVLAFVIICLFVITYWGENANVLNYNRVLTDKYASWEQDLKQREDVIRKKEKELQIKDYE